MGLHKSASVAAVLALGIAGGLVGCGSVTDADKALNYQNKRAGEFIEESAESPPVKQAGKDIKDNAGGIEKSIGLPKAPKPYSPQASSDSRSRRDEEHKPKWWQIALSAVGTFILGGGAVRILATVAPRIFGGPAGAALSAVITGIANVREAAKATPDGKVALGAPGQAGTVLGELAKAQEDANVRELVRTWVKALERKLGG